MTTLTAAGLLGLGLIGAPGTASTASAAELCRGVVATIVGTPGSTITGTEGTDVVVTNGATSVSTLGGNDRVCLTWPADAQRSVVVDLGGGDDSVAAADGLPEQGSLVGGEGRDLVALGSTDQDVEIDLEDGELTVDGTPAPPTVGFEDAFAAAPVVELRGTDDDNDLWAVSCDVRLDGRNGRDRLWQGGDWAFYGTFPACSERTTMRGGRGHDLLRSRAGADDRMVGGRGNDTIDARGGRDVVFGGPGNERATLGNDRDVFWGGPGRDRVDGGFATDLCRAERERRCER